jgi:GT2 family glycosyltransferase
VGIGEGDGAVVDDVDARADEALNRFLPPDIVPGVPRTHHVTGLVLSRDGELWLARTLKAIGAQVRPVDEVVGIDAGSSDDSAQILSEAFSTTVLVRPEAEGAGGEPAGGMARALAAGVAATASGAAGTASGDPDEVAVAWYWILHDESAPEPACLEALLMGADRNPNAGILVPKTVAWSDSGRLVGVGNRWAPGSPVVDPLDAKERDQGQYDVDRPVYTGDSAGMLVRADLWHALDGMDPAVGDWAGPADLCRRVWGSGSEVFFIPTAVLAHRQAGHRGARPGQAGSAHPRRAAREGQLTLELTQAPVWALGWRYLRAWLSTAARMLALLLTREPEEATAEVAGAWGVLGHPGRLHRARRRLRRAPVTDLRRPPHVRARRGVTFTHSLDSWSAAGGGSPARVWWPPPARIWHPMAVAGTLVLAAFVREPGQFLGSGTLRGGGLLPAPGAVDLVSAYLASWHDAGFGTGVPLPAYLPLLAGASVVTLGSTDALLRILFGLAVPLAFLSCYLSIRPIVSARQRIPMALAYALLPAGAAATAGGRVSTLAVLLLAPPTARLVVVAFTRTRGGVRGIRPALAAGTMLGIVVAFAPSVYVVAVIVALLVWIGLRFARWPLRTGLTILGTAGLFLVLWSPRLLSAPWLALSEAGVNDPTLGNPQAWVWGLDPGGPNSVTWAGVPLVVIAGLAVLVARLSAPAVALLAGAAALLAAGAWLQPLGVRAWPDLAVGMLWPGVPLVLAGGLLVVLVATGASRSGVAGRALSLGWVVIVGALLAGWWAVPVDVAVGGATGIPPVVGLDAESPARPRSLVLARDGGSLRYAVASGPQVALGDADALAGLEVDPAFADAVAGLVSGASGTVERELGGRAIRFVVFDGPPDDPVVGELDATIGLRQLARAPEQSLWLVAGNPTRAELSATGGDTGGSAADPIEVPILTTPTSIDVVLHPQTQLPRRLVVAEQADPGWDASVSGIAIDLVPDPQGMLQATVTVPGDLTVRHTSLWPGLAAAQLVVIAGLIILSLPKRRRVDPDAAGESGATPGRDETVQRGAQPGGDQVGGAQVAEAELAEAELAEADEEAQA